MSTITHTPDQKAALEAITKDLGTELLLTGDAGTGKTSTIIEAVKYMLKERDWRIAMTAPTNKAKMVLEEKAHQAGLEHERLHFFTCHSLLGLVLGKPDPKTGERKLKKGFKPYNEPGFLNFDLVIVDECSMVDETLYDYFLEAQENGKESDYDAVFMQQKGKNASYIPDNTRIMFVGDPEQLPPVKETGSQTFRGADHHWHLESPVRFQGGILQYSTAIRQLKSRDESGVIPDSPDLVLAEKDEWLNKAISLFKSPEYESNPDYCRMIAWTNKQVDTLNNVVRGEIYGYDAPEYRVGDILYATNPCMDFSGGQRDKLLDISFECEVTGTRFTTDEVGFHVWKLQARRLFDNRSIELTVLSNQSYTGWSKICDALKAEAKQLYNKSKKARNPSEERTLREDASSKWSEYRYWYEEKYHQVKYNYAMTAHKSQGSTFNHVFVDKEDLNKCWTFNDWKKLNYVAVTRAANVVYLHI